MKRPIITLLLAASALSVSCSKDAGTQPVSTGSNDVCTFTLGYHRTVLYNDRAGVTANKTIDAIKATGAQTIRISVKGGREADAMKHILYCNSIDIPVTLMIHTSGLPLSCYEDGTTLSPGDSDHGFFRNYPISRLIPSRYEDWITSLLTMYKKAGCKIDVLEVGNEILWCAFNPDVPITGGIVYDNTYSWDEIPQSSRDAAIRTGEISVITKTACRKIYYENPPKVIYASLNLNEGRGYYINTGGCIVTPEVGIAIACGKYPGMPEGSPDYIKELDGIAVHFYPEKIPYNEDYNIMKANSLKFLSWFMDGILEYTHKPVYVTELGFLYTEDGPDNDWKRTERFRALLDAMDETDWKYNWEQVHIYSWDQNDWAMIGPRGNVLDAGINVIKNYYSKLQQQ